MLDGERRQMSIMNQAGTGTGRYQLPKDVGMLIRGLRNPSRFRSQPFLDLIPGLFNRYRTLKNTRIGNQTHKRKQAGPRQANPAGSREALIQPRLGTGVLRGGADMCINE